MADNTIHNQDDQNESLKANKQESSPPDLEMVSKMEISSSSDDGDNDSDSEDSEDSEDGDPCCNLCSHITKAVDSFTLPCCPLDDFDFCRSCRANRKLEELACITMDRVNFSEADKPRIWPCWFCGKKLGGGFSWHCSQLSNSPVVDMMNLLNLGQEVPPGLFALGPESQGIDICNDCYGHSDTAGVARG